MTKKNFQAIMLLVVISEKKILSKIFRFMPLKSEKNKKNNEN
jgi:hypothetical protein